ncbi:hypothetical protein [Spirosoma areae]
MPHFLSAGPVRVRYENGFLRYLTLNGVEVLRMIYVAVRDANWLTASLIVSNETIEETPDSFSVQYDWLIDDLGIQMAGQVIIRGDSGGTIAVDFYGKALHSFRKNRLGLCVLHPIDGILGQPVAITEPDGSLTNGQFPTFISPHQPFLNIQTLRWKPASGVPLQLDFSGEVFEMEDQRNWTDASFKTYSTPLERPFPVAVSAGDEFWQRVAFSLSEEWLPQPNINKTDFQVVDKKPASAGHKPLIGTCQRTDGKLLTGDEADLLKKLNLSQLRADVFFRLPDWQTRLNNALADAQRLAVPLELALFFGNDPLNEFQALQSFLQATNAAVRSTLLFNGATLITSTELLQTVVPLLRTEWPGLLIGGGSDGYFADVNRNRFNYELVDFVTYSINPQVHASDDLTLMENIAGQAYTVLSARALSGGKPIHISPVTLRPRFTTVAGTATERLTSPADPRQSTDFGADWTRQSLNALIQAGVASITYYQTHGPAGLIDGEKVFPVYTVFA